MQKKFSALSLVNGQKLRKYEAYFESQCIMARANTLQTSPYVPHDIPIIIDNITFTEYYLIHKMRYKD